MSDRQCGRQSPAAVPPLTHQQAVEVVRLRLHGSTKELNRSLLNADAAPTYTLGREGAGSLALYFDGEDDQLTSGRFDPREFRPGPPTFTALSQAWIRPDPAGTGQATSGLGTRHRQRRCRHHRGRILAATRFGDHSGYRFHRHRWRLASGLMWQCFARVVRLGYTLTANWRWNGAIRWNGPSEVSVGTTLTGENPFKGAIDDFNIAGFSDWEFRPGARHRLLRSGQFQRRAG